MIHLQFAFDNDAPKMTVRCTREVILAAGGVFSPALLQISGIGPQAMLASIGVNSVVDLPGVGNNFQDHPMIQAGESQPQLTRFSALLTILPVYNC